MRDIEKNGDLLKKLKSKHFKILVRDFGTGKSSLGQLHTLPIDYIKLHKMFVQELGRDKHDTAIVKSMIELAQGLGIKVIASSIETKQQLEFLIENGCSWGQGDYFGDSLESDEINKLIR